MDPRFSVIVTTFRRPRLLAQALASVQAQTVVDFECIVVDDGSHTAEDAVPDDDRFRLVALDRNGGATRARNRGLAEANGEVVAFLDDDDLWTPTRLALAERGLARAPIAICGSRWSHSSTPSRDRRLDGDVHDVIVDRFTPNLGRTAVRRTALRPFDERFDACEDVDWWIDATARVPTASVVDVGLVSRRHPGVRHGNGAEARITGSLLLLTKHADYFARHAEGRAFRQYRIGVLLHSLGRRAEARRWLRTSLVSCPRRRTLWALASTTVTHRPAR